MAVIVKLSLESTILDMSGDTPTILRPGMITGEMLEEIIGKSVAHAKKDTPKRAGYASFALRTDDENYFNF